MPDLIFHKGDDYAVILRPDDTTDRPLAHLYGKGAANYGRLFTASPDLLAALKGLLPKGKAWRDGTMDHMPGVKAARLAIAKAEGR